VKITLKPSSPVWVVSAPGLPYGARLLGQDPTSDMFWIDMCMLGQHLPQMFKGAEIRPLAKVECAPLGLCGDCLGFGDMDPRPASRRSFAEIARNVSQVIRPCGTCHGSGRPALRVTVYHADDGHGVIVEPVPHAYLPPSSFANGEDAFYTDKRALFSATDDMCLACAMPEDARGPKNEVYHVDPE
jgi:hypothetical protein